MGMENEAREKYQQLFYGTKLLVDMSSKESIYKLKGRRVWQGIFSKDRVHT